MRPTLRRAWLDLLAGALGFALLWGGWHLVVDHQNFHALLQYVQEQAKAAKP